MTNALPLPFNEYRKDGWPLCPRCEEDELYSFLMLGWTKPEPPSVAECIATGMMCYRCSWELPPSRQPRIYPDCFRCEKPFELEYGEPQYTYCPNCREAIRAESEERRLKVEVDAMGWPETIG